MLHHFLDVLLTLLFPLCHPELQASIDIRLQILQAQILQLVFHPSNAQATCQRRINFKRLLGYLFLLDLVKMLQRPHVMQAVGQLDENDPDVVRHREHHLSEVFGLFFLIVPEVDLADLRHTVHQMHNVLAKLMLQFIGRGERIFERVMQQPGGDGGHV